MDAPDAAAAARGRQVLSAAGIVLLHEDNHVLVVAKPAGLPTQGGPRLDDHLVARLARYREVAERKPGRAFVGLVHRLDRNVGGVLVVAKTSKAAARLAERFRARSPEVAKRYLAWVAGIPEAPAGRLVDRLVREDGRTRRAGPSDDGAREARLAWRLEGRAGDAARLVVELETGFGHQIRCQLALAGHPLLGDLKYGGPRGPRPALHAASLSFPHPVGGRVLSFTAPLPDDLVRLDARFSPPHRDSGSEGRSA